MGRYEAAKMKHRFSIVPASCGMLHTMRRLLERSYFSAVVPAASQNVSALASACGPPPRHVRSSREQQVHIGTDQQRNASRPQYAAPWLCPCKHDCGATRSDACPHRLPWLCSPGRLAAAASVAPAACIAMRSKWRQATLSSGTFQHLDLGSSCVTISNSQSIPPLACSIQAVVASASDG